MSAKTTDVVYARWRTSTFPSQCAWSSDAGISGPLDSSGSPHNLVSPFSRLDSPIYLVMGTLEGINLRHASQRCPDTTGSSLQCMSTLITATGCILKSALFFTPKGRAMYYYGRTTRWAPAIASVMNGRQVEHLLWTRAQVAESMRFRTHVQWFSCCDMYYQLLQYRTFLFFHYEHVCRTHKVCVSGPIFIGLFFLHWWVLKPLKIFDTLATCIVHSFSGTIISIYWNNESKIPLLNHSKSFLK